MEKIWFVYIDNVVRGPFATDYVKTQISQGQWSKDCHIWWKGQREWMPISEWLLQSDAIVDKQQVRQANPVWYLDSGSSSIGPLTESEVLSSLKLEPNLSRVKVWNASLPKWTSVFEVSELMDELGISRREVERAPIMGTVSVTRTNDSPQTMSAQAATVSILGMGLNGISNLRKDDEVHLILKSHEFPMPLHFRGSIVYVTPKGHAGVRFTSVSAEAQSMLFDYVRKFVPAATTLKKAA